MPNFILQEFWAEPGRYEAFRAGFRALNSILLKPDQWYRNHLRRFANANGLNKDYTCSDRSIDRFLGEPVIKKPLSRALKTTGLLLACEPLIKPEFLNHPDPAIAGPIKDLQTLINDCKQVWSLTPKQDSPALHTPPPHIDTALSFISEHLKINTRSFLTIAQAIFKDWDPKHLETPREEHFLCYRYDTTPGRIAKSFTSVFSPTPDAPLCRFKNFYCDDRKRKRTVEGIIIPTKTTLYFLGTIHNQQALKLMAFPHRNQADDIYNGLLLTHAESHLAARIVMVRTDITKDADAGIGIHSAADLRKEISPHQRDLKNFINFKADKKFRYRGQVVSQTEMVSIVDKHLKDEHGNPLLTYEDGQSFPPASTDHYTFNSALQLRSPNEPHDD